MNQISFCLFMNPAAKRLATTTLGLLLLFFIYNFCVRNSIGYTFIQSLIDWRYGIVRRGLFGEILRHIISPPYKEELYYNFSIYLSAINIFLLGVIILFRSKSTNSFFFMLLFIGSPLTVKNFIFDIGRSDSFAQLFFLLSVFLYLAMNNISVIYLSFFTIPIMSLISENTLFLYSPTIIYLCFCKLQNLKVSMNYFNSLLIVWTLSLIINLLLSSPAIPYDEFHAYIASKSTEVYDTYPESWLYESSMNAFRLTVKQMNEIFTNKANLAPLIINAFIVVFTWCHIYKILIASKVLLVEKIILLTIFLLYFVLFALGTDWLRWISNLTYIAFILIFINSDRWELDLNSLNYSAADILVVLVLTIVPIGVGIGFGRSPSMDFIARIDPGVHPLNDEASQFLNDVFRRKDDTQNK